MSVIPRILGVLLLAFAGMIVLRHIQTSWPENFSLWHMIIAAGFAAAGGLLLTQKRRA